MGCGGLEKKSSYYSVSDPTYVLVLDVSGSVKLTKKNCTVNVEFGRLK